MCALFGTRTTRQGVKRTEQGQLKAIKMQCARLYLGGFLILKMRYEKGGTTKDGV